MFRNYLKTTLRSLWKDKSFSFLNIAGLAVGIASAALILLWVEDELDFNCFFSSRDHLYRIMENQQDAGKINTSSSTPGPLAEAVKKEIPGIKESGRLSWAMDELMVLGDKSIKTNGLYADPTILRMLDIPFVYGSAKDAFTQQESAVISESLAKKLFGEQNPVGKTIKMNARQSYSVDGLYTITGVFKDLPQNASYQFQWVSPYTVFENKNDWIKPWSNNLTETLVELSPEADIHAINKTLKDYLEKKAGRTNTQAFLFAMDDWNLRNHFTDGKQDGGNIKYVRLFSMVAAIILVLACINFMNLSTARSEKRAREVGVRKVMGAGRGRLILQFITESLAMSFAAVLLAVILVYLILPAYGQLVKKDFSHSVLSVAHLMALLGIGLLAGLLAGSYPAFYLSSFNPVRVLKGLKLKTGGSVLFVRRGLVTGQFTASIMLIICTLIIYQQIQHIRQRDLGYDKDRILSMDVEGEMKTHFGEIKDRLRSSGLVDNAAISLHGPLHVYSYTSDFNWQGKNPNDKISIYSNSVSPEFISVMNMKIIAGRDFYQTQGADSGHIIINEAAAKIMGSQGRVGGRISINQYNLQIVGVIKNVVFNDAYMPANPLVLFYNPYPATVMTIRINKNAKLENALEKIRTVMKEVNPGYPFEFTFLDEEFNQLFVTESLVGRLAGIFSALAIFISCLGLFGLAAYSAERRKKEIGIRKVLGASVGGLAGLVTKEFLLLVILSCVIAFPLAWFTMTKWLQDFQYRIDIKWWVFAAAGLGAIAVALITVSFQAMKAALLNPVKSIRME